MSNANGTESTVPPGALTASYRPAGASYDEMAFSDLRIRPAWRQFVASLEQEGADGLNQRTEQVRRLLRENGVTYNVYGAAKDLERPWTLDPLPVLLAENEWNNVADGVAQRAELLNRLLGDLYGPQTLLASGAIPPSLLYEHPGFLLPCVGVKPFGGVSLHWYGAQVARDATGHWVIVADRTQGPSGAGHAVENRLIVSRTLPNDFQDLKVVRLASYFVTLKNTLTGLAQQLADNPRIVLLSPGPKSARYFEDVYLARYLGYNLVEGEDLTVRGEGVFLKTLDGLLPVHAMLRRSIDAACDPLDLRPDITGGVAALVHVARMRRVIIANALGSGMLEAPILLALLPDICRQLLGQPLKLPSIPTWWLGNPESRRWVESRLDQFVIRPAFTNAPEKTWLGWRLSNEERSRLLSEIQTRPSHFVAQQPIEHSTTPVWTGSQLQPWRLTLRTFAVAGPNGYQVMPGGLCRVAPRTEMLSESMASGQRSKDLWILSDRPVETVSLLRPQAPALQLRRTINDLPSRAADYLFWLGRLTERAEALVRHVRCIVARMTAEVQPAGLPELKMLIAALCEPGKSPIEQVAGNSPSAWSLLRKEVWSFLANRRRSGSLADTLDSARQTASVVRDRISIDSWRILNQMDLFADMGGDVDLGEALPKLNELLTLLSAFSGLGADSMTRGPGWRFLDIGRRIERAVQTLRVVRGLLVDAKVDLLPRLEAMLEIADSSMTYRYRYLTTLQLAPVLDLVLADDANPRAVIYQLVALIEHGKHLPGAGAQAPETNEQRLARELYTDLRLADIEGLCQVNGDGDRHFLAKRMEEWTANLFALSNSMTHTYLTHTVASRQLEQILATEGKP